MMLAPGVEADPILPRLWQGSAPAHGATLQHLGFDLVVFCALEWQPRPAKYRGVRVLLSPNDDDPTRALRPAELRRFLRTANVVAEHLRRGHTVLTTCIQGRNRSGLVNALALVNLYKMSGSEALALVQSKRANALTNPQFQKLLKVYF